MRLHARQTPRVNFAWAATGTAVYGLCQWLILLLLARIGGPTAVGEFAFAVALTGPVMLASNLQLRELLATDAQNEYRFGTYLELRLTMTALGLMVIAAFLFLGGYSPARQQVIALVALARTFDGLSDVFLGRFQRCERMQYNAVYWLTNGLASLAGVALAAPHGILVASCAYAFGSALALAAVVVPLSLRMRSVVATALAVSMRPGSRRALFSKALPLGIAALVASLNANIPRYYLARYAGTSALGVFAALASLLTVGATVIGALSQAVGPRLADAYAARERRHFVRLLGRALGVGALVGVIAVLAAVLFGEAIVTALFGAEYAGERASLIVVMLAAAFSYVAWFLNTALVALRRLTTQVPLFAGVALVSVVACQWLVPAYGIMGAATALAISTGAQLVWSTLLARVALDTRRWRGREHTPAVPEVATA